jgi:hypothetical protein
MKAKGAKPPSQEDLLQRLVVAVEQLTQEVRMLGQAVDRLQDDFAWALDNGRIPTDPTDKVGWLRSTLVPFADGADSGEDAFRQPEEPLESPCPCLGQRELF